MKLEAEMAVAQAVAYEGETLPPRIVAPILRMDEQTYRVLARSERDKFPFPIIVAGSRVRTPKRPFLKAMGIEE